MSVKRKTKALFFKVLSWLPDTSGTAIYHYVQNRINNSDLDQKISSSLNSYNDLTRIFDKTGINPENKHFLEIGSGWLPLMPFFLMYVGKAREIDTYDLNKHYQTAKIKELKHIFSQRFVCDIKTDPKNCFGLPEGINYFPKTNLATASIKGGDIVFSRFVLEHINLNDLRRIHTNLKKQLKSGTHIIHFISPSDHRAYDDPSLSLQDFLRFSQNEWEEVQTKFDYHNRLRLPHYLSLFQELELELVYLEYEIPKKDSETYEKFKAVPLHQDYLDFSDDELLAGSINVVLKI